MNQQQQNAAIIAAAKNSSATNNISSPADSGGSGSTSSQVTAIVGSGNNNNSLSTTITASTTLNNYSLHEQSEKKFTKWLQEIEQSLQFIEKRLEAESALNQSGSKFENGDDDPLYTNVSEMQQMHMNYFEKIKVMIIIIISIL